MVTGLRLATAEIRREEPPLNDEEMAGEQVLPSDQPAYVMPIPGAREECMGTGTERRRSCQGVWLRTGLQSASRCS